MANLTYTWQQAVQDAICESDPNQAEQKIRRAELAIFERIDTFSAADSEEETALFEAFGKLRAMSLSAKSRRTGKS